MQYKILVVDDSKSIYRMISQMLQPKGCSVDFAPDGQSGLLQSKITSYDLIFLDIHMPVINGLDVCKALKRNSTYEHRPIILLTSDSLNLEEGLTSGAADYVLKPFKEVELVARAFAQIRISRISLSMKFRTEQLQRDLLEQESRLNDAEHDLQNYFYQSAHKLRSPINSIQGLFNLMKLEFPGSVVNPYYPLIDNTIGRLSYVNEQVSRIGFLKSSRPNNKCFSLRPLIEKTITNKNVNMEIEEDITLFTDDVIFRYGIEPIIDNAIHYSKQHQSEPKVSVSTNEIDGKVQLIVQDNGPGIAESNLHKVLEMFFIGDETSTGNGLGLSISRLALSQINLAIDIQSKKNHFTKISIDITHALCCHHNYFNEDRIKSA